MRGGYGDMGELLLFAWQRNSRAGVLEENIPTTTDKTLPLFCSLPSRVISFHLSFRHLHLCQYSPPFIGLFPPLSLAPSWGSAGETFPYSVLLHQQLSALRSSSKGASPWHHDNQISSSSDQRWVHGHLYLQQSFQVFSPFIRINLSDHSNPNLGPEAQN